jgi:ABC-type multidrug transport system permease subunit
VEEFMNTFAVVVSGFVQVFTEEIQGIRMLTEMRFKDIPVTAVTPFLEKSKQKIIALQDYLDPLLIKLKEEMKEKEKKEQEQPGFNIFAFVLPAISVMFLLFIIEIFLRDIIIEREQGTLQRILFSSIRPVEYILAKILSGWLMGIMAYLVIVVAGKLIFDISWGNYWYLFIFLTATCFWIAGFFALLNSFLKNRNQAGAITAPIVIVFSAFGGSMVQVSQMPEAFQAVSRFTLNYWFIEGIGKITKGGFPALPFLIISVTGTVLVILSIMFLKKKIRV